VSVTSVQFFGTPFACFELTSVTLASAYVAISNTSK
jgi:hypothetical protein